MNANATSPTGQIAPSGQKSRGVVTTPRKNGPTVGSPLLGEALDLETMPALVAGRCNWCAEPLRKEQVKLCSSYCRKEWDREMRVLGMKLAERLLHLAERRRGKPLDGIYKRAFSEAQRLPRNFMMRLRATRNHYGWGKSTASQTSKQSAKET